MQQPLPTQTGKLWLLISLALYISWMIFLFYLSVVTAKN
jgi:hypothetical protein